MQKIQTIIQEIEEEEKILNPTEEKKQEDPIILFLNQMKENQDNLGQQLQDLEQIREEKEKYKEKGKDKDKEKEKQIIPGSGLYKGEMNPIQIHLKKKNIVRTGSKSSLA